MDLSILNERQRDAVVSTEGRIRVVAGAGSGKTRALAYRYAYIVNEIGIDPANLLCLTFTNKAAQEMKSRISQLVPPGYTNDFVCTIHGFCVRFLREEIHRLGYPKTFQILDEDDMKSLAKQVLTENNTERSVKTVRDLLDKLAGYKTHNPYVRDIIVDRKTIEDRAVLSQQVQLIHKQKDKLALDFDDLLAFTLHILHAYPEVCSKWQERMSYVMIDEAQDCNGSDWDLVETLSAVCGNLFVVGDPDQSIYEWRGAKPDRFVSFGCDRTIVLDENYRSTPGILSVANAIIVNNRNRIPKDMFTRRGAGENIVHFHGRDEKQEAAWVCAEIMRRIGEGARYSDFAVLFRAAHLSRFIEQTMIQMGIPYVMWGGVRFFERQEVKDCVSYLRLIGCDDDLAFERIVNTPSRKVGKITLELISTYASEENTSLFQALRNHLGEGKLDKAALREFVDLVENCRLRMDSMPVSTMMEHILEKTGLKKEYRDDNDEQRLENITELLNSMRMWESERIDQESDLNAYLQDIALYTNADYRKETDKVKLMTVHQSKGLEFPYVFIIGLSEGIFPNARSIRERKKAALEEERRLMYVATTRAEKRLYMTESEGFNVQAQQEKLPSRFIAEIGRELFVTEGEMDEALWNRLKLHLTIEELPDSPDSSYEDEEESGIKPGMTVEHRLFGTGTVEEITDNGSCKVRFGNGAIRFLRPDVLKPVAVVSIPVSPQKGRNKLS
ncbi:MAG: ATP-dependent helicase [Bacteroidales bacterium]|nr:ATP-dependent helicase [Bacteroidales bacterium]